MEKQNESMRDRLLARLPRTENLEAYREETESLLRQHQRAIFWGEKFPARVLTWLGVAVGMMANSTWGPKLDTNGHIGLNAIAGILLFTAAMNELGYRISLSKVDLLKEIKQVQLQVLELQASLEKNNSQ
ncbi:MAG: hypothetical protein ABSF70_03270 [Terracidiphilus sp.]|jgi:hypothetical protein